ncbi:MAG: DUF1343 domain-containing protein [Bacteroidales bacterium]|nr:DUF1343 domain-containing protein [Bacteroidales bacterium]
MKNVLYCGLMLLITLAGCAQPVPKSLSGHPAAEELKTGAECMDDYLRALEGRKVAVCGNHTSLVGATHLVDTLLSRGVAVVKIFSPEHGFRGNAEAGAAVSSSTDAKTGLPIVSLYGKNKKPTAEQMSGVDVVLFDLQDVGCRFYTYISTLHYVMEAAAENDVEVIVLDRPNPNGFYVDGPVMKPQFTSFVGMHHVPVVYGMTIGEYAQMINGEGWLNDGVKCKLLVVRLKNYTHSTRYVLPVPPSPNLQTPEAVFLYPSLCFFEGTDISVGRGTEMPFEMYGAPGMTDGDYFFTPHPIKGVSENPPHNKAKCRGTLLHKYAAENIYNPGKLDLTFLIKAYKTYPHKEKFFNRASFFDKLAGNDELRKQIVNGVSEEEIRKSWEVDIQKFMKVRERYLLYK